MYIYIYIYIYTYKYMRIFQRTPGNLKSYYGNKFWNIANKTNSHA